MLDKNQAMKYYCGTPLNMAPEVLNDKFYTYKADMWSFGVAMFEALCHRSPFNGSDKPDLKFNVNLGLINIPPDVNLSKQCLDFLMKCLSQDPKSRFTVEHALNHPFMSDKSPDYIEGIDIFHPVVIPVDPESINEQPVLNKIDKALIG